MPTLIEMKSLEACAALCKELDLQFVELNMNLPEYQVDGIGANAFAEIAQRYGIYYTIHLDENLNPCDFNAKVSDAYTDTVLRTIELAKQVHIPVLNMHLSKGVYFTLPEKKIYLFDKYWDIYLSKLTTFRDLCEKAIGGADIKICIENANGYWGLPYISKSVDVLIRSAAFALTFDIGHNAYADGSDEPLILGRANKLIHMHIHDAVGRHPHLPLGTGELDLRKYFSLADIYNCRVVLETKTVAGLKESVKWIKDKWRKGHG